MPQHWLVIASILGYVLHIEGGYTMEARKAAPGVQIKVSTLMERARQIAELSDFGDLWFLDPLNGLVDLVNKEAALEFGRYAGRARSSQVSG